MIRMAPSGLLFLMLFGNLIETFIVNIERWLRFLCFGETFYEVPIIMTEVAFERNLFIIQGPEMAPTLQVELNCLW
jgi:hypothetical protein